MGDEDQDSVLLAHAQVLKMKHNPGGRLPSIPEVVPQRGEDKEANQQQILRSYTELFLYLGPSIRRKEDRKAPNTLDASSVMPAGEKDRLRFGQKTKESRVDNKLNTDQIRSRISLISRLMSSKGKDAHQDLTVGSQMRAKYVYGFDGNLNAPIQ